MPMFVTELFGTGGLQVRMIVVQGELALLPQDTGNVHTSKLVSTPRGFVYRYAEPMSSHSKFVPVYARTDIHELGIRKTYGISFSTRDQRIF